MPVSDAGTRIAAREAQLIAQLADGTIEQPMKELCRRYEKDLYRFGVHFLSREEMAEILVQETFQRLCHGAGQYNPGAPVPAPSCSASPVPWPSACGSGRRTRPLPPALRP